MQYQIPKGLFDILPYGAENPWQLSEKWHYIESIIHKVALDYGYKEIRTPIFERTELFIRGVGETSDIVSKEMYTFLDKAERSMTLRPEGTAPIMRAFIENNLSSLGKLHKLYYFEPMFRYDRPQAGRYRQHHQFGVEAIGNTSFEQDAEVIDLMLEVYRRTNLKNITLLINTVGDAESRKNFKRALQEFLQPSLLNLSKDSQERFDKNPLRILDSKDEKDIEILKTGPNIFDYLTSRSKNHFTSLLKFLDNLKISYKIDQKLVRGLDYYDNTVFEAVSSDLGAQSSLGGGGRYDKLLSNFGGPDLSGIGFGMGIERLLQTMIKQNSPFPSESFPFVYFIPLDETAKEICFKLASELRHMQIPTEIDLTSQKIQKGLQNANKLGALNCVILGEEELKINKAQLKNLANRSQEEIDLDKLVELIQNQYQNFKGLKHV
ncbi:MAG: histidine--tRNA ligase [Chlamydiae bacterium]|nr:histidine--tRNA ligase [Chlamydiota bacterium]